MSATPDSLYADGSSTATITTGTILNNDGSIIDNGKQITVYLSNATFTNPDADNERAGFQVITSGGVAQFEIQSSQIALPIEINAVSTQGYAFGYTQLKQYDYTAPATPTNLTGYSEHNTIFLSWEESSDIDLAGYKISYDTDLSGEPYNGTAKVNGINSPILIGASSNYQITGLTNSETYYISVQAVDVAGNLSDYSNEIVVSPQLNEVKDLTIEFNESGAHLNWLPVEGANSYKIYRSTTPLGMGGRMELIQQTTASHYIDVEAFGTNKYFYIVVVVAY